MEHGIIVPKPTKRDPSLRSSPVWEASCLGKIPYASKADALHRIRCQAKHRSGRHRRVKTYTTVKGKLSAYRCLHCGHWHVGSSGHK